MTPATSNDNESLQATQPGDDREPIAEAIRHFGGNPTDTEEGEA